MRLGPIGAVLAVVLAAVPARAQAPLRGPLPLAEAMRLALARNANILIQTQQVRIGEGLTQQALGVYDPALVARSERQRTARPLAANEIADQLAATGANRRAEEGWSTGYRFGIEQQLPSGVGVEGGVSVNSTSTNLNADRGIPRQTAGSVRFGLRIPLARNLGGILNATTLRASEYEREASFEDLVQTGAGVALSVTQTYWELAARLRRLEILRASEQRGSELVAELRKLIAADQVPAAELHLGLASEAEKRAARAGEEQQLQQAWNALGRLLNVDTREVSAAALTTDPLPEISDQAVRAATAATAQPALALERRADLRSARLRERAAHELVIGAQNALRPQLDLLAGVTSNGLAEGASSLSLAPAIDSHRPVPALSVALELRWPWRNNAAEGLLVTRFAGHDQAVARLREIERSIVPSLVTARVSLQRTAERYRETAAAAERYAASVHNERTKRRLGLSTLIDVITVQDRLDNAQLALLQLRQDYASLLAQVLFESGTLAARAGDEFEVDVRALQGLR